MDIFSFAVKSFIVHAFKGPAVFTIELTTKKHKESLSACFTSWQKCLLYILYIYIYNWLVRSGSWYTEWDWKRDFKIRNKIFRLEARAINKHQKNYQISKLIICHELSKIVYSYTKTAKFVSCYSPYIQVNSLKKSSFCSL